MPRFIFELPELLTFQVNNTCSANGSMNVPAPSTFKLQTPVGWKTSAPGETSYELVSYIFDAEDYCAYVKTDSSPPTRGNWFKISQCKSELAMNPPSKGCVFIYQKKH